MSDRSFGDYMNRNIVKNPLLSSAVTGLSIEDLTPIAVLLPVSQSQDVVTRPEPQLETQSRSLANIQHVTSNLPSGDTNAYPATSFVPTDPHNPDRSTQSKASLKSEDDFDVNEYFARLQGTRYVSAPINVKDDNANLEATEENLEEINLNEPEQQQSITSDIAHNFSQLPAVFPQVASAVFSSFSNMLSLKSREHTPEHKYQETKSYVQCERDAKSVPMMDINSGVKEILPPPKEPPISGTSNFRLPTKKKYAQVPGLTSNTQMSFYSPTVQNTPPYFSPTETAKNIEISHVIDKPDNSNTREDKDFSTTSEPFAIRNSTFQEDKREEFKAVLPQIVSMPSQNIQLLTPLSSENEYQSQTMPHVSHNTVVPPSIFPASNAASTETFQTAPPLSQPSPFIPPPPSSQSSFFIPPPPMFSNQPRTNQTVGKAILPPSVARKIGLNHPVIKSSTPQSSHMSNIFVPAPIEDTSTAGTENSALPACVAFTHKTTKASPLEFNQTALCSTDTIAPPPMFNTAPSMTANMPASVSLIMPQSLSPSLPPSFTQSMTPSLTPNIPQSMTPSMPPNIPASVPPNMASNLIPTMPPRIAQNLPQSMPPMSSKPVTTFQSSTAAMTTTVVTSFTSPVTFQQPSLSSTVPSVPALISSPTILSPFTTPESTSDVTSVVFPSSTMPTVTMYTSKSRSKEPQPSFFNPNALQTENSVFNQAFEVPEPDTLQNVPNTFNTSQPEPPKPLAEPPKAIGGNFRMTKKRPQYYSGPIEGIGSISNNVKPTIQPVETNTFQGSFFTPQQTGENTEAVDRIQPFDISRPAESATPANQFDLTQQEPCNQPCNTAFDLSRPSTEAYEPPKEESGGFGLIGSLKSKLSALDMNKIQNSVTTFFDPGYKNVKEPENVQPTQESPYEQKQIPTQQAQGQSNFEIFVPNQYQHMNKPYRFHSQDYNHSYYQDYYQNAQALSAPQQYTSNTSSEDTSVYSNNSYRQFPQNIAPPMSYATLPSDSSQANLIEPDHFIPFTYSQHSIENVPSGANIIEQTDEVPSYTNTARTYSIETALTSTSSTPLIQKQSDDDINLLATQTDSEIFDQSNLVLDSKKAIQPEPSFLFKPDSNPSDFFSNLDYESQVNARDMFGNTDFDVKEVDEYTKDQEDMPLELPADNNPNLTMSAAPLYGLSTMLANKTKELSDLENDMKILELRGTPKEIDSIFNRNSNTSFFENVSSNESGDVRKDDIPELNICETCREVNKPEDYEKDTDDLTSHLIENIVSPIQLSNPVEAPLTESNIQEDRSNFDTEQCEEISHITEDTIETLQVQSATELLDDASSSSNIRSLWAGDHASIDQFYSEEFYGQSYFANASDEIKAELFGNEKSPVVLPRQMSIPSAPPAEEKETGPDVHSIEQDANKDFPIFEESVIEPSETDDDKIVYYEREKSTDGSPEDSFTSRVEKFKKMETGQQMEKPLSVLFKSTCSPSLPIASYFDTGNFAVETHFRNSLTSPPGTQNLGSGISVPPGFEEEYQNRVNLKTDVNDVIRVPDTSTQTKCRDSPTYSTAQNAQNVVTMSVSSKMSDQHHPSLVPNSSRMSDDVQKSIFTEGTRNTSIISEQNQTDVHIFSSSQDANTMPFFEQFTSRAQNQDDEFTGTPYFLSSSTDNGDPNPIQLAFEQSVTREMGQNLKVSRSIESPHKEEDIQLIKHLAEVAKPRERQQNQHFGEFARESARPRSLLTSCVNDETISSQYKIFGDNNESGTEAVRKLLPGVDIVQETGKTEHNIFGDCKEDTSAEVTSHLLSGIANISPKSDKPEHIFGDVKDRTCTEGVLQLPGFFNTSKVQDDLGSVKKPCQNVPDNPQPLSDPITFFSSVESPENSDFTRLASYFSSPPKTQESKPFFELSQGQNHLRISSKPDDFDPGRTNDHLNQRQNHPNIFNISQKQYEANLNLMRDLTSVQNLETPPDQIVKQTNYFTVEYDSEILKTKTDVIDQKPGKLDYVDLELQTAFVNKTDDLKESEKTELDDIAVNEIIKKCKHCCDLKYGYIGRHYNIYHERVLARPTKVKSCMNSSAPPKEQMADDDNGVDKRPMSVSVGTDRFSIENETSDGVMIGSDKEGRSSMEYSPVRHHWFYRVDVEGKSTWRGFSELDSKALENAFNSSDLCESTLVPTDGGRYDVNVTGRLRCAVYWSDKPANVRRCSWFYKGTTDARYVPYTETVAEKLEEEYRRGMTTGEWHRRLVLPNNELVVMHGPAVMVHFLQNSAADAFSGPSMFAFGKRVYRNPPKISVARDIPQRIDHLLLLVHGAGEYSHQKEKHQSMMRPRVVRRGHDESEIEDVEPSSIDHLLLFCHGVGSACDMRFRSVEEVVDDFRSASLQLIQAHYKSSYENGTVGRVEVLPISWHTTLHSGESGVDRRLDRITLSSIPRLRAFTNDTVLDVLFYTSPVYCQTILNTVCTELNRVYRLFRSRNPTFDGGVSLGGHSLGSVILYDLLCNQTPILKSPKVSAEQSQSSIHSEKKYVPTVSHGLPNIVYPQLDFAPTSLYALGSPIAIFECIRGVEMLGTDFRLPTCRHFFNIFHPYDPIAYRIEPLINPDLENVKPLLIPHHKGRKRMHLELKETMARVGADLKQKLIESVKSTWTSMWKAPPTDKQLEKVVEEEMEKEPLTDECKDDAPPADAAVRVTPEMLGQLNDGLRVDHVLQEAPFEMINEYLFAMSSHVCYWESEDTMLLILRQIYDSLGVQPDCTVPQQNLTVQRTRIVKTEDAPAECPSTSRGAP